MVKKSDLPVAGDRVKIDLIKTEYEGILLETPVDEKGIVLIKLDSGYNMGFIRKDILDITLLKKAVKTEDKIVLKKNNEKPNIGMIITGGTIASKYDPSSGGVKWLNTPESLFKFYPGIFEKVNVVKVEVPFMKGSENMDPKDWKEIARIAETMLNDSNIKGIIITHGTDILHYTGAALSFFLRNLNKPVVLTYSQRSIDRASSDANLNLQCAALASISDIAEVMLIGHSSDNDDFCYALRGTKVRKMHSSRRDAFKPINEKPIAKIYSDTIEVIGDYNIRNSKRLEASPKLQSSGRKVKVDAKFEEKVALLKFYPGQSPDILDYYVKNKYRGIVIEMTGLGHVATSESRQSWITKLKEVQKKGMIICAVTQCLYGRVDPLVYSAGRELMNTGIIYLEDMLSETAYVKLGWVLGHKDWASSRETIKEKMLENVAGEFNKRLEQ